MLARRHRNQSNDRKINQGNWPGLTCPSLAGFNLSDDTSVQVCVLVGLVVSVLSWLSWPRLKLVILIVDVRRDPNPEDATLLEWFRHYSLNFLVVMTKVDKVSRNEAGKQKQNFKNFFGLKEDEIIPFSAVSGEGRNEIWKKIEAAIEAGSKGSREASDLYRPF